MSRIIERVRQALGVTANDGRDKLVFAKSADFCACASAPIAAEERAGWMDRIREEAKALNLQVHESPDLAACGAAIAARAQERAPEWGTVKQIMRWSDPLLDGLGLEARLPEGRGLLVAKDARDRHARQHPVRSSLTVDLRR